ncbi:WD40-repeat-containing domain protein, partial [Cerioporus squamosus]
ENHDTGITCVAFSCQGTFLASAGLDGRVCIWEVNSQRLLHMYKCETSISSISWMQNGEDSLIVGYEDGNVGTLSMTSNVLTLNGFWAHDHCVDSLANQGHMIATGAQSEVRVWEWHPRSEPWKLLVAFAEPQKSAQNLTLEVLVVSMHWVMFGADPSVLAVSYQNHGILFYETTSWAVVHVLDPRDPIACTSFSSDGMLVATSSKAGIEVRSVSDGAVCCAFLHDAPEKYLVPVLFIHGGQAIASGSTTGAVHIWGRDWSHKLQTLQHQSE